MARYASDLNQLQDSLTDAAAKIVNSANTQLTKRIYKALNANTAFVGIAGEVVGRMVIKVSDDVYTEDTDAVNALADTLVKILTEGYYTVAAFMTVKDAQAYIIAAASNVSLTIDL